MHATCQLRTMPNPLGTKVETGSKPTRCCMNPAAPASILCLLPLPTLRRNEIFRSMGYGVVVCIETDILPETRLTGFDLARCLLPGFRDIPFWWDFGLETTIALPETSSNVMAYPETGVVSLFGPFSNASRSVNPATAAEFAELFQPTSHFLWADCLYATELCE